MAEIAKETIGGAVSVDIPILPRRRMLNRVPMHLRVGKEHIYEPVVVPLGPYHRKRHPQEQLVEPLKNELRDLVCRGDDCKNFFLSKIRDRIDDIKHFYGGAHGYTADELAEMMLQDACFIICYLQKNKYYDVLTIRHLGMREALFMWRDIFMLENQIPLWVISSILPDQLLIRESLSLNKFGDRSMTQPPWENGGGDEPLHLLEACHRTTFLLDETRENSSKFFQFIEKYNPPRVRKESSRTPWQEWNCPFWSATDLNAKGIHFRPSSKRLTDIKFFSFAFYAELHLPSFFVTNNTEVYFSNLIAFEMSPETDTEFGVTSYFSFMKTLINNAKDVKVLREKGILYSMLVSDEEVLEMFKSIDTCGYSSDELLRNVKMSIEKHCNSKARTWMAELINTNFRNPWTVIALAAAIFLLFLTAAQTYYTIK